MRGLRSTISKALAVAVGMSMASVAIGKPGAVLNSAAPVIGADAPAGVTIATGDSSVAPNTGAFQYSYRIAVPPGRAGMQPTLALAYSSQAGRYGSLAAGWDFSVPQIKRDWSEGHFGAERWVSSMAGGRELVATTTETKAPDVLATYRAQSDDSFARYQQLRAQSSSDPTWRVLTTTGVTYEFGGHGASHFVDSAPLTRMRDAFGNEVRYQWDRITGADGGWVSSRLRRITYSHNESAGLDYHASVSFAYAPQSTACGASSASRIDYDSGIKRAHWPTRLDTITTEVRSEPGGPLAVVRNVELSYDAAARRCNADHAPVRLLTAVRETDAGGNLLRPPVTFAYADAGPGATRTVGFSNPDGVPSSHAFGWGKRLRSFGKVSTLEAQLLDVNGDGRVDRVYEDADVGDTKCTIRWERNTPVPPGSSTAIQPRIEFIAQASHTVAPVMEWANKDQSGTLYGTMGTEEDCSLSGQLSYYSNKQPPDTSVCNRPHLGNQLAYRFLDINGDGKTDLVTALHYDANYYEPGPAQLPANNESGMQETDTPMCPWVKPECIEDATACPVHADVCNGTYDRDKLATCDVYAPTYPCVLTALEMTKTGDDGDVTTSMAPPPRTNCPAARTPETAYGKHLWKVYWGKGDGSFDTTHVTPVLAPIPLSAAAGDPVSNGGRDVAAGDQAIIDLDGDGFVDAVKKVGRWVPYWHFWRGDGKGGFTGRTDDEPHLWMVPKAAKPSSTTKRNAGAGTSEVVGTHSLIDVNADGRPDYVHIADGGVEVHYNMGRGFAPVGETLPGLSLVSASQHDSSVETGTAGNHRTILRATDLDGDGRVDWHGAPIPVFAQPDEQMEYVPRSATALPVIRWNAGGANESLLPPRTKDIQWVHEQMSVTDNSWSNVDPGFRTSS